MLSRQRGAFNLWWVGIGSMLLAGVAMMALISMRQDRNLFAEVAGKAVKSVNDSKAAPVIEATRQAASGDNGKLRKCVINGKTVVSNAECADDNPTSKDLKIQVTRGVEMPKPPPPPKETAGSNPMLDKIIDAQSR